MEERPDGKSGPPDVREPATSRPDRFWSAVGKLGVLVGTLLALNALVQAIRPREPRVVAYCEGRLSTPPEVLLRYQLRPEDVTALVRAGLLGPNVALSSAVADSVVDAMGQHLHKALTELPKQQRITPGEMSCQVENSGQTEARDVEIDASIGVAASAVDGVWSEGQGTVVKVGTLRPGNTRWVHVLFLYPGVIWESGAVKVTHAQGVGTARVNLRVYTTSAVLVEFLRRADPWQGLGLAVVALLMLSVVLAAGVFVYRSRLRRSPGSD